MPAEPENHPPSWRKAVVFFAIIATIFTSALALSVYKIAVANAYVTQKWPIFEQALPQPAHGNISRGAHVADLVGCADCHGADYGGRTLVDKPRYATIIAPNLTSGAGGRGRILSDAALARVLQAGLDGEQRMLWGMPRSSLNALAQDDVWAVVAFLRALPAIDREHKKNRLNFWGYVDVAVRGLRLVDRARIPLVPPKIPRPTVGLDNAVVSFGAEPQEYANWRLRAPAAGDEDEASYLRAVSGCDACHGTTAPVVGRTQAPPLDAAKQDINHCQVGSRLSRLTSNERAAMFDR